MELTDREREVVRAALWEYTRPSQRSASYEGMPKWPSVDIVSSAAQRAVARDLYFRLGEHYAST